MDTFYELLFLAWCSPYNPEQAPERRENKSPLAYGQYTFREGLQLGLCLAIGALTEYSD